MLRLRKGKKTIKEYAEPYSVADDVETLNSLFPSEQIPSIQRFIRHNAFGLSIRGTKARLGGGVMLETA